jgi:hypothetical protein
VLTEGAVQAGQEVFKLASGPEGMTVAEMDALLYMPGHPRQQMHPGHLVAARRAPPRR